MQDIRDKFGKYFQGDGNIFTVRAPGRINLIGEHTDYNGGFVLPAALEQQVVMAGQRREDEKVSIYAEIPDEEVTFSLSRIERDPQHVWADYLKGVIFMLRERGIVLSGMNIYVGGDVPVGAGVSSSAALEVAAAFLFRESCGFSLGLVDMAKLCQRAENEFVGMRCGLMDQFICCLGRKGTVLFLDCLKEEYEFIPLKKRYRLVVCNTGIRRELADSEYNRRREECESGTAVLGKFVPGITCLRQVSVVDFEKFKDMLPGTVRKRCRHVVYENKRVLKAVNALREDKIKEFGKLMKESHESLKDDYEVSCLELDLMVDIAGRQEGCIGSRMSGAGFGGCTVNLIEEEHILKFVEDVKSKYCSKTGIDPEIYVSHPANGVNSGT